MANTGGMFIRNLAIKGRLIERGFYLTNQLHTGAFNQKRAFNQGTLVPWFNGSFTV